MTYDRETARRVKELAREAGFDSVRIASAEPLKAEGERYLRWIDENRQAEMRWITTDRAIRSSDPTAILPGARSVVCVALSYWTGHRPRSNGTTGRVARYAWGDDYHAAMGERLARLAEGMTAELGGEHRWYVDTGPLMDRALAVRAGLGWYGKNSNVLTEEFGSYVLLGEMLTTVDLAPDPPIHRSCGSCRLCLVACPTGALSPEYWLDSGKCISYLTIEHRGSIPLELRAKMGDWVFGCDICQDVCPPTMRPHLETDEQRRSWTEETRAYVAGDAGQVSGMQGEEPAAALDHPLFARDVRPSLDLAWLLHLSHADYLEAFRGTAIKRAKVWMLRRNAAVALGNVGGGDAIRHLGRALREDEHPVVRGHAAWALGRLAERTGTPECVDVLAAALREEGDATVRAEIEHALAMTRPSPLRQEIAGG